MNKTLNEQKQRIQELIKFYDDEGNYNPMSNKSGEWENLPPDKENELQLSDHVYAPLSDFRLHVNSNDEKGNLKDSIDFTVKGNPDAGNLKITNMDVNDDYTDEEIQRAKEMVEKAISKGYSFPSGASFSLKDPRKTGEIEF